MALTGCGAMLNIWQQCVGFGCGFSEELVSGGEFFAAVLVDLERYDLDRTLWRELAHADVNRRAAAADAVMRAFDYGDLSLDDEAAVRDWWTRTEASLRDAAE